jgi:hypothetical protein
MNRKERRRQAKLNRQNAKKWNFVSEKEAKANSNSNIPNMLKGESFKLNTGPMGGVILDVSTEFNKLLTVVTDEVVPYNTRSNITDFNSLNWGNDGGFFMACMPVSEVPQNGAIGFLVHEEFRYKQDRVTEVINQFKITKLGNGYVLISTFCTPDRAWQHFTEIADTMRYAFVGYSTPSQIAPLAEDRELCLALSKGKNHNIKAEVA